MKQILDTLFDEFWKLYPNKKAKGAAKKAWSKLRQEDKEKCIKVLPHHIKQEQWLNDGGKYIPHPATWLNQERWEDEIVNYEKKKKESYLAPIWKPPT